MDRPYIRTCRYCGMDHVHDAMLYVVAYRFRNSRKGGWVPSITSWRTC
jgi:hypothetical protein